MNNRIPPGNQDALRKSLELYASADLVLSSRLHACIIALAQGCPVLAVSGDRKVESFMNAAGLAEWVCALEEIDSIPARLEQLPTQRSPVEFIEQGRQQNHEIARRILAGLPGAVSPGTAPAEIAQKAGGAPT